MAKNKKKFNISEKIEDSGRIEKIAVGHLDRVINEETNRLESGIPVDDKGVSFDGFISLTNGKNTKAGFMGRVPVQVKGKQINSNIGFPKKIKYSLARSHFENYYIEGGVLLIVVGIINDLKAKRTHKQIYVAYLLRTKIFNLLKSIPSSQASITTTVYEIEDSELEKICFDFFDMLDKQPAMVELDEHSLPMNGILTETAISRKQNFLDKEFYVSKEKNGVFSNCITPIALKRSFTSLLVYVGNHEYNLFASYEGRKEKRGNGTEEVHKLIIEEQVEITFGKKPKITINSLKFNSLSYQLRVLPFLKDLFENKQLKISEVIDTKIDKLSITNEELKQIGNNITLMESIFKIFEEHHIPIDTIIEGNYDQIIENLSGLKEVFIKNKHTMLKDFDNTFSIMVKINIMDTYFLTFYNKEKNVFEYPFKKQLVKESLIISNKEYEKGESFPSIYISLIDFYKICNINYNAILESFDNIEEIGALGHDTINSFLLERIKEFDKYKDIEILNFCIALYKKCLQKMESSDNNYSIYTINYFQCIRRTRKLENEEAFKLGRLELSKTLKEKGLAQFCIDVIIGDINQAKNSIGEIKNIEKFPIFNLYNSLFEENLN